MSETVQLPDSLSFRIPPSWDDVPIEAEAFKVWHDESVRSAEEAGLPRSQIRQFELLMARTRQELLEGRAIAAATLVQPVSSDEEDAEPELLLAAVSLTVQTREELGAPVPLRTDYLLQAMTNGQTEENDDVADLEPPKIVDLPAGEGLRLIRLRTESDPSTGQMARVFSQSYLVPLADGEAVAILGFLTPTIRQARPMAEVFSAMARSLVAYYPGDDTTTGIQPSG